MHTGCGRISHGDSQSGGGKPGVFAQDKGKDQKNIVEEAREEAILPRYWVGAGLEV